MRGQGTPAHLACPARAPTRHPTQNPGLGTKSLHLLNNRHERILGKQSKPWRRSSVTVSTLHHFLSKALISLNPHPQIYQTPQHPFAAAPLPRIRRAPSFLLSENLSHAPSKASFTNALLPITAPSVKYLTRILNIFSCVRSGRPIVWPVFSRCSMIFPMFMFRISAAFASVGWCAGSIVRSLSIVGIGSFLFLLFEKNR